MERWAPLNRRLHQVLAHRPPCRPCGYDTCPTEHECAQGVSVAQVINALRPRLAGWTRHAA
jgi:ADP-heptose:LPS heptosyltransferase